MHIKSLSEDGTYEGYGAVFGNVDSYNDVIQRGAFKKFLATNKPSSVKLLWQHNTSKPIGVYEDMYEDENGLYVKGRLLVNDVQKAREAYALLKAGAISGLSIGFSVNPGGQKMGADGNKYISDIKLWEISIVTFPANPEANVESVKSITDFEKFLRDAGGFSKSQARRIASQGFKNVDQCDADETNDLDTQLLLSKLKALKQSIKEF